MADLARKAERSKHLATLASELEPYLVTRLARINTGTQAAASGLTAHALDGAYHTGTLATSQAPWAVTTTTFNTHAADSDAHHARQHDITSASDHTITGAALSVVGATSTNTLGLLTPSSSPGAAEALLKSSSAGLLTLPQFTATTKVRTPTIDTASGTLSLQPAGTTTQVVGALRSTYSTTDSGGAIVQNVVDSGTSFARAWFGHNAKYDLTGDIWNIDNVGANDASGLLLRNNAGAIDFVFHTSSGASSRTMDHATFTAGTKFTMTSAGRFGVLNTTPSYEVDITGSLRATTSVITPLITTATNADLLIDPAGTGAVTFGNDQTLRTSSFDSSTPITGWQINEHPDISDYSVLTIGKIQADELAVRVFVADETRVDRGDEYWTKSYGIVADTFTTPASIGGTVSVKFEDSPALVGAIFTNNDWILIRKLDIDTGITLSNIWGQMATYVNNSDGSQNWTFTLRSGPTSETVTKGSMAIDFGASGAALIHLSVIDAAGAPYIKMRKWSGANPYTPSNFTTYVQLGQLGSIGNSYVTPSGYGLYVRSTANAAQFIVADDNGLQIRGADIKLYNGTDQTVNLSYTGTDVWVGTSSSDKRLQWNGSSLNLNNSSGSAVITLDNSGNSYFAGVMTIGSSGEIRQGTGTLGTDYTGLRIWRDTNVGRIAGYNSNTLQWYAATDGKLYAGAGDVTLDANGIKVKSTSSYAFKNALSFTNSSGNEEARIFVANSAGQVNYNLDAVPYASTSNRNAVINITATPLGTGTGQVNIAAQNTGGTINLTASGGISTTGDLGVTGNISVTGNVDGVDVSAFKSAYDSHNHDSTYLKLAGGQTLTGTVTTRTLQPSANNTYDLGNSSNYYNNLYARNLYVDTIVGTPSYSHTHSASDITSGTLDEDRLPHNWTGALTLDADSGGTYNYLRIKTDATTPKIWDIIGYAQDHATTSVRNDLALTFYDGSTVYMVFEVENSTRVLNFGQTPTVGGTAVSLSGHTHDDRYFTETESDARFAALSHNQAYTTITYSGLTSGHFFKATGTTTVGFSALTSGEVTTALGYTPVNKAGDSGVGALTIVSNTEGSGSSNQTYQLGISKSGAGSLQLGTHSGYPAISGQGTGSGFRLLLNPENGGNVGIYTTDPQYKLDVNGTGRFVGALTASTSVATPTVTTASGNLSLTSIGGTVAVTGALTGSSTAAFTTSVSTPTVTTASGNLALTSAGGTVAVTGALSISGAILAAAGSVSAPGVAQSSDPDTGMYWPAANTLAFSAGGTQRLQLSSTGAAVTGILSATSGMVAPSVTTASGNLALSGAGGSVTITGALVGSSWDITNTGSATMATSVITPTVTASSGNLTVTAPATLVLNAATSNSVELQVNSVSQWSANDTRLNPRSTIVMDLGDYNRKLRTLYAAEMYVETLVAQDVMSTIGGRIIVAPTTTLIADLSNSATTNLFSNLQAYWSLDEASGNKADSKGGNTLTNTNTVSTVAGKVGNASSFTKASSQYLTIADNATLSVGDIDFYFSFWVYPTLDDDTDQYIAAKAGGSGNRAWDLRIDWVNARLRFSVYNPSDTATTVNSANSSIAINTWYFVECWHDSVNNQIAVAINNGTAVTAAHTTGVKDDTGPFQIGARNAGSFFQGYVDGFGFWKYIPSSTDRAFLYNSGTGRTYSNMSAWSSIDVKHNSLSSGTYVYLQTAPGGISQIEAMQVISSATAITGGYRYQTLRNLDGTGNNTWVAGDAVVSLGSSVGQGYIDLTSTSTIHSHLGPTITVFSRSDTSAWNSVKPVVTMGNLRSFVDYSGDEYGQAAGNDLTLNPASGFAGYTIDRTNGLRLFNTDLRLYNGATEAVRINNSVGLRFITATNQAYNRVSWYNAIGGYDQASIYGDLVSGTASLGLRAIAKDTGTGAYSGYADVILSNATTTSSIRMLAHDGSVNGPNLYMDVAHNGVTINSLGLTIAPPASSPAITIVSGTNNNSASISINDYDNGSSFGTAIRIGRNSNGSTPAAGFLYMLARTGTAYALWADNAGVARIGTTLPTNAQDTSGTVVGSQTSWVGIKNSITEWTDTPTALDAVLSLPLFSYKLNGDATEREYRGIVINDDDRGAWFSENDAENQTPALNERNLFGYLIAAIKEQQAQIESLKALVYAN